MKIQKRKQECYAKYGDALSYDEIASYHPHPFKRTISLEGIVEWAKGQEDLFVIHPTNNTFHLKKT